jgi:hypothetical protein
VRGDLGMNLSETTPDEGLVLLRNCNSRCLGKCNFPAAAFRTEVSIGWTKLGVLSVKVVHVRLNALAARAICHSLVEISALLADPDRRNSAGKAILAITEVPVFFGLFRHVSSLQVLEELTRPGHAARWMRRLKSSGVRVSLSFGGMALSSYLRRENQ